MFSMSRHARLYVWGLLLLLVAPVAEAQGALVVGRAVDDSTGAPVVGAHVFVPGATVGTVTNASGRFTLQPRPGPVVEVEVSALGYAGASVVLDVSGDPVRVEFRLRPSVVRLPEVAVTGEREPDRDRAVAVFRDVFVGRTPNARAARLENPEVLRFELTERRLRAEAEAPLAMRNDTLGYAVTVHGLRLVAENGVRDWVGGVQFTDVCAPSCSSSVAEARAAAFQGSLLHFLRAAAAGRLHEEGFTVDHVWGTPSTGFFDAHKTVGGTPEVRPDGGAWVLQLGRAVRVSRVGDDGWTETSWLTARGREIRFTSEGQVLNGADVSRHGRWDSERMADRLPFDYGLSGD